MTTWHKKSVEEVTENASKRQEKEEITEEKQKTWWGSVWKKGWSKIEWSY